jgi:hypothetical protein
VTNENESNYGVMAINSLGLQFWYTVEYLMATMKTKGFQAQQEFLTFS